MGSNRIIFIASGVLVFLVLAGGITMLSLLVGIQLELAGRSRDIREEGVLIVTQLERETWLLRHRLGLFCEGREGITAKTIQLQFDTLDSQLKNLEIGMLGGSYMTLAGSDMALQAGKRMLKNVGQRIPDLQQGDSKSRDAIFEYIDPVLDKFITVSQNASRLRQLRQKQWFRTMKQRGVIVMVLVAGVTLSGAILAFMLVKKQIFSDVCSLRLEEVVHARTAELEESNQNLKMLSQAVEQSPVSVIICDPEGIIEYVNPKFEEVTGYIFKEAVGKNPRFIQSGETAEETYRDMWQVVRDDRVWKGELCNRRKNGELFWEHMSLSPIKNSREEIRGYLAVKEDISQRKLYEEQLLRQANYDDLTGLPNRMLAMDRLSHAILQEQRRGGAVALLFVDLDNFKLVNDTLGHDSGDKLLTMAARRFVGCLRDCDTAARFGGDEFLIILSELQGAADVLPILGRIVSAFGKPFSIEGHDFFATASIGVSMCPEDSTKAMELLKNSDSAMYEAKKFGKNKYCFFGRQPEKG